ncbi:hypothetical protein T12_6294 [Trichinella patagoniensis]|uniref:Uncharacterized protein n=1 Tax=Trichinella patagoniensis TaxID=990121 RepID=A0A0V0ZP69_9BILA|nr:hypothetical protein T12_6294 [Trichinella patagoniensis]
MCGQKLAYGQLKVYVSYCKDSTLLNVIYMIRSSYGKHNIKHLRNISGDVKKRQYEAMAKIRKRKSQIIDKFEALRPVAES